MHSQAQALVTDWTKTFNGGQVADLARFYAPEARIVPPGRPAVSGAAEITRFFADIRAQGFRDYAVDINDEFTKDGVLIASGRWALQGPSVGGVPQLYEGNWLNVLDRGGGGWLIAAHMWN